MSSDNISEREKEEEGKRMTSILDDAATIVAKREHLYDLVVADLYYMAQLSDDWKTQNHIWQEEWDQGNNKLIVLLISAEMHLNYDE